MDKEYLEEIADCLKKFLVEFEKLHGVKVRASNDCCSCSGSIEITHPDAGYANVKEYE